MTEETLEQNVEMVEIEVDGKPVRVRKGAMLIEATDAAGIDVPRFCYHRKLSIAANCRMCLVEVEKAPKPLPACATPVADGMKVWTGSERALDAQQGTMEFLLINHPLDCPVCDQGGECELQDVALGYGEGISRFTESKRAVADEDLGPLISTDMTRCIHCTRCVRFGTEIAGVRELGATGRGEEMRIGTYVGRTVSSEMSGNVIDLCPVGALTNKPARYTFRPWELLQQPTVSPHDSIGSNVFMHQRRGRIMRAVPRDNERINETWIADRDRYSCHGLYADDRVMLPLIKCDGIWEEVDWDVALPAAAEALRDVTARHGGDGVAGVISGYATTEEHYLGQKLIRGLGSPHVDHRLRQLDFSDQDQAPVMPWLGQSIEQLEKLDAALLVGSNVRKEQPLAAHRLRKAVIGHGARVSFLNARRFDWHFDVDREIAVRPDRMVASLAGIAAAVAERAGTELPRDLAPLAGKGVPDGEQRAVAEALVDGASSTVLLGSQALGHPELATLRRLAAAIAQMATARFGYLPEYGNAAGAWLAGCVPHRGPGGQAVDTAGATAADFWSSPKPGYLLLGVEPEFDSVDAAAAKAALDAAESVVAIAPFTSDAMLQYADIILPGTTFAETDGTFVNAEGLWQNFSAAGTPPGDSRPNWKILRVLGNELGIAGFEYHAAAEIRRELKERCREVTLDNTVPAGESLPETRSIDGLVRYGDVPMYSVDPLVRRSRPLQEAADAGQPAARVAPADAARLGLTDAERVTVRQGAQAGVLDLLVDVRIPEGCVWIPQGMEATGTLGPVFGGVELERA
ncbi:NADH-quinone oxidoreductase subunit NuoG [Halofilum ochraceum]|uniref:NADH-quinone oxidoreductase subunit NuoG n=1 Tax=Halofilum ochraceum TaxID=1611323 RepID=UPI0008DA4B39|nr:NADH-quinone oxidoreductase subunit NuoG [Halofilum ochraceum]